MRWPAAYSAAAMLWPAWAEIVRPAKVNVKDCLGSLAEDIGGPSEETSLMRHPQVGAGVTRLPTKRWPAPYWCGRRARQPANARNRNDDASARVGLRADSWRRG